MVAPAASGMSHGRQKLNSRLPSPKKVVKPVRTKTPTLSDSSGSDAEQHSTIVSSPIKTANSNVSPTDAQHNRTNSLGSLRPSSRAGSVFSLSRSSLSSQISQLTSLTLPDPTTLSSSISSIPTAQAAATTLSGSAEQIKKWLQKATEVLKGLDAEDDVEWAAAGGREGLEEVDGAIGKFEGLIEVYVVAIEELQVRPDVAAVPSDQLSAQVEQMETILHDWEGAKKSLKGIKYQMELAMEWEELWNVVLGDIGLEMENLSRLVFEMEEARHRAVENALDGNGFLDLQELDTIVEESPAANEKLLHRKKPSSPPLGNAADQALSPLSPTLGIAPNDSRLLALFARMQPLRASLDFLPMTLANFRLRAEKIFPSGCQEVDNRKVAMEKKWKLLEGDAHGLRQELGEDRWVLVFRNAGQQAQKLCDSVERSLVKVQEAIEAAMQQSNPVLIAKRVEAYEAKKNHYGPAIKKVLSIIEKGVIDRQTVNGEILRVHLDTKARWQALEAEVRLMDTRVEELNLAKSPPLRDSISSIVSMDRSAAGSSIGTPGSSPASSIVLGPSSNANKDRSPVVETSPRISGSSFGASSGRTPSTTRRYVSTPSSTSSHAKTGLPRSTMPVPTHSPAIPSQTASRRTSISPQRNPHATPRPLQKRASAAFSRAGLLPSPSPRTPNIKEPPKPRWNTSARVANNDYSSAPRPYPYSRRPSQHFTPSTATQSNLPLRSPSALAMSRSSGTTTPTSQSSYSSRAAPSAGRYRHHYPGTSTSDRLGHADPLKTPTQHHPPRPSTSLGMSSHDTGTSRRASHLPLARQNPSAAKSHLLASPSAAGVNARAGSALGQSKRLPVPSAHR